MDAEAQALPRRRSVIAAHLIHTLYGHWAANDPRGSGSSVLHDEKFAPLGEIHHGRKPEAQQPTGAHLRAFHRQHEELLNFPLIWMHDAMRQEAAQAVESTIQERGYTCYACAVCRNHLHLVIRTHRDRAQAMWEHFAQSIRERLRLRFPQQINPQHPVISARPYNVLLYTPHEVRTRISYISANPPREQLPPQPWRYITPYNNWPFHRQTPTP